MGVIGGQGMQALKRYCFYSKDPNGRRVLRVVWYRGKATKEIKERLEKKPLEWFSKK